MRPDDPDRKKARSSFLAAIRSVYALDPNDQFQVPYSDGVLSGVLPAYRFTPVPSKGTFVFFGGFDSYIEELVVAFLYLHDQGYEVIAALLHKSASGRVFPSVEQSHPTR